MTRIRTLTIYIISLCDRVFPDDLDARLVLMPRIGIFGEPIPIFSLSWRYGMGSAT
ncbi:MAG: hypothetical protein QOH31_5433 [Verrucomicrobiota bacterium]|jgi:hypothetical protein